MVPEARVIYEGRRFKLEVGLVSPGGKVRKYTFERCALNGFHQHLANQYT